MRRINKYGIIVECKHRKDECQGCRYYGTWHCYPEYHEEVEE